MTHADALEVLAAYLHARNEQGQPNGEPYQPKTLTQFLRAAHLYLQQVSGLTIVVKTGEGKEANYLPMFSDTISLTHKWKQPRPKREAYTTEIFQALQAMVKEHTRIDKTAYLDLVPTVFDWLCLGVFTGSRAGEYAQTVAKRGDFSRVPPTKAAGRWRDYATAFVRQDFTFLDARAHIMTPGPPSNTATKCRTCKSATDLTRARTTLSFVSTSGGPASSVLWKPPCPFSSAPFSSKQRRRSL